LGCVNLGRLGSPGRWRSVWGRGRFWTIAVW
jgi:hypothetical protein